MKLIWRVQPAPTGRYRSFDRRGWPVAETAKGDWVAALYCADDYVPRYVKTANHAPIEIRVMIDVPAEDVAKYGPRRWATLKTQAATLAEAKAIAEDFVSRNEHRFSQART